MAVALGDAGRAEDAMLLGISLVLVSVGLVLVGGVLLRSARRPVAPVRVRRQPMPALEMRALRLSPPPQAPPRLLPTPTPILEQPAHERVTEPGLPAIDALSEAPTGPASRPRDEARDFFTKATTTMDTALLRQLRAEAPTRPVRLAGPSAPTTPLRRR